MGHTLLELLVVLVILGMVARIAIPQTEPAASLRLDAAALDVAQALRYAQSAALRTGAYHLVRCDTAGGVIAITRLDLTVKPPVPDLTIAVLHPVDKRDYKIVFNSASSSSSSVSSPVTQSAALVSCAFTFSDKTTLAQVAFGDDGAPVNLIGKAAADIKALTGTGQIVLGAGRQQRTIAVSAPSGRVTIAP